MYFTNLSTPAMISDPDAYDLSEVLGDCTADNVDLLIHTPGGVVDACEQIISVLKLRLPGGYRVVIPGMAKSAGTVVALSATQIVMGVNSELGPIDPQFGGVPAEFIANDPEAPHQVQQIAQSAILRMRKMAKFVLETGMLHDQTPDKIDEVVVQLSSAQSYLSHGAVINAVEAEELGLNINYLGPQDRLWQKFWFLFCMYDYDCRQLGYSKIFEGARISLAKPVPSRSGGEG
ncbi:SDH family Clp fold serine proteinase [Gloeobacter violaceus]|uniref:SDH family Clp fold serine proteinase n=1 Tax=Gloeobacter violaceus TaxID=33072 RepID=UPI0002EE99BD|nr:ATP-dependent Clp protease proteolytic subunit [Gloeobacter violaceus]